MFILVLLILLLFFVMNINSIEYIDASNNILTYSDMPCLPINNKIPEIIFRTSQFPVTKLPRQIYDNLMKLNSDNPEYRQFYFDDIDVYQFIMDKYPQYIKYYNSLIPHAYKADFWRILVLYYYGGIYNDIGHSYLTNISNIIFDDSQFVTVVDSPQAPYYLHNAFIAAYARHPILKNMIDAMINNIQNKNYGENPVDVVSCGPLGRVFNIYFERPIDQPIKPGRFILNNNSADIYKLVGPPNTKIISVDGTVIINTKFKNYNLVMYNNRPRYDELWHNKNVFKIGENF